MASENTSAESSESQSPIAQKPRTRFAFVSENSQTTARSHAMREHWRERKERTRVPKSARIQPILLPKANQVTNRVRKGHANPDCGSLTKHNDQKDPTLTRQLVMYNETQHDDAPMESPFGVASALLGGINRALSSSRLDPFGMFPVSLTSQHHKLLYHWINTHAAMMFEDIDIPSFNPMKDVWFPLDLSNASSFNCIMAHSAAHLAHLYAGTSPGRPTSSSDALKYKTEAVKILGTWLSDPEKALSNDAFAAVLRLLTFERYWGTEKEWIIHRNGLQRMIDARGGIIKLQDNWRLELAVYLVSLMTKPSWFESVNNISEISESPVHCGVLDPSLDIQKVRCLWLISFIQDMRTFMGSSSRFYVEGISRYSSLYDAVRLLYLSFQQVGQDTSLDDGASASEFDILVCLFSISVVMQESISLPYIHPADQPSSANGLAILDIALANSRRLWEGSVHNLRAFLHHHLLEFHLDGAHKIDYIMKMTDVLTYLSVEARRGVQKCLLNMLRRSKDSEVVFLIDDGWTPDSLLSSVHGQ